MNSDGEGSLFRQSLFLRQSKWQMLQGWMNKMAYKHMLEGRGNTSILTSILKPDLWSERCDVRQYTH